MEVSTAAQETQVDPQEFERLMQQRHEEFIQEAVDKGLMSAEFAHSEVLRQFAVNAARGKDPLIHIFRGDWRGGIHHIPSYAALNSPAGGVASLVWDENKKATGSDEPIPWPEQHQQYKQRQSARENGTYDVFHVHTGDLHPVTGEITVHDKKVGSSMFPDDWSMERVILAIAEVTTLEPRKFDSKQGIYTHIGIVDGVQIEAKTDQNGKITAAYPTLRQPNGKLPKQ